MGKKKSIKKKEQDANMSALSISYWDPDDLQTRVKDLETKLKYLNTENT